MTYLNTKWSQLLVNMNMQIIISDMLDKGFEFEVPEDEVPDGTIAPEYYPWPL